MKRLTSVEKDKIISLMRDGKSLNYISRVTGKSKSTLYYHYKRLLGKKLKKVKLPEDNSFIGELVGLFVGDGNLFHDKVGGHYIVRFFFNVKERDYVENIVKLFNSCLLKKPQLHREKNVLVVKYYSKDLFYFIKRYVGWGISLDKRGANQKSRTVFLRGEEHSIDFKKGFLRGFIDSDGYLSKNKVLFGSASERVMKQTYNFLIDLKFEKFKLSYYKRDKGRGVGIWHLYVHKVERDKFFLLIKPRNIVNLS